MNTQFDVTLIPATSPEPPRDGSPGLEAIHLLRQLVDMQREQVALMRTMAAAHDALARWKVFLNRWRDDFPDLADGCRDTLPVLERTYAALIAELVEHLRQNDTGGLDTDFALQEFLDKYGMRLAQLGTILNLVAPLAEAGSQAGSS
jgi:hypothetical protein